MSKVLFVCVGNSGRSVIAERLFRRNAGDRHETRSAGSRPSSSPLSVVVEALTEVGIDASDHTPRMLDQDLAEWADVVVATCDVACPTVAGRRYIAWDLPDPKNMSIEEVRLLRDDIDTRVHDLLVDLDGQTEERAVG